MDFFSRLDAKTLVTCLCILVAVFATMLLCLRSLHPRLPGITSVSAGFALGAGGTLFFAAENYLPHSASVGAGGCLALCSTLMLFRGVLHFCRLERPKPEMKSRLRETAAANRSSNIVRIFYGLCGCALILLAYFTSVHPSERGRVTVLLLLTAVSRLLMARELYCAAAGRKYLLAFAFTLTLVAVLSAGVAGVGLVDPHHAAKEVANMESGTLLFSVMMVSVQGVFYLLMFAGSVTESIHEQAQLDYLTGALNRRGIEDALTAEIARTKRSGGGFSVLLIDVDHFKTINDRFGHAAGDDALQKVARSIHQTVRVYDILGRYGGDEFLVVLPQTDGDHAMAIAERIREAVATVGDLPGNIRLTLSIGATTGSYPEEMCDIVARADAGLYDAKRANRDCVRLDSAVKSLDSLIGGGHMALMQETDALTVVASLRGSA
jgi:diguanylate cyclase (GGDEF)-like protein